jgi:hypothetical protein
MSFADGLVFPPRLTARRVSNSGRLDAKILTEEVSCEVLHFDLFWGCDSVELETQSI